VCKTYRPVGYFQWVVLVRNEPGAREVAEAGKGDIAGAHHLCRLLRLLRSLSEWCELAACKQHHQ
jgi:hypothetical protein